MKDFLHCLVTTTCDRAPGSRFTSMRSDIIRVTKESVVSWHWDRYTLSPETPISGMSYRAFTCRAELGRLRENWADSVIWDSLQSWYRHRKRQPSVLYLLGNMFFKRKRTFANDYQGKNDQTEAVTDLTWIDWMSGKFWKCRIFSNRSPTSKRSTLGLS